MQCATVLHCLPPAGSERDFTGEMTLFTPDVESTLLLEGGRGDVRPIDIISLSRMHSVGSILYWRAVADERTAAPMQWQQLLSELRGALPQTRPLAIASWWGCSLNHGSGFLLERWHLSRADFQLREVLRCTTKGACSTTAANSWGEVDWTWGCPGRRPAQHRLLSPRKCRWPKFWAPGHHLQRPPYYQDHQRFPPRRLLPTNGHNLRYYPCEWNIWIRRYFWRYYVHRGVVR